MNWSRIRLILRREYLESVRKKSFLFGLVATPAVFAAAAFLPILARGTMAESRPTLAVLDETEVWGDRLRRSFEDGKAGDSSIVTVWTPGRAPSPRTIDLMVAAGDLTGWIRLPADFEETGEFEYHARAVLDLPVLENLETRVGRLLAEHRAAEAGLARAEVEDLLRPVELSVFRSGDGGSRETNPEALYMRAVVLVMMLFFALVPTGQILMRSVIEEKSNRVVEILLSSVTSRELMVGKVLGLGAVGLTLLGAWGVAAALLSMKLGRSLPIGPAEAGMFLLYFLPGYLFYAALLGAVGSVCSAERDAQPFLAPISLMLVLPILAGLAIAQNPDHWLARGLSFFPPLTPSLMLFRFTIQPPPFWEIAGTWLALAGGTVLMVWISARVFRTGILMTGKRPTIPEIWRWVRAG